MPSRVATQDLGLRAPAPGAPSVASSTAPRADIQGLRALAVAAVLAYHVWPSAVPGGYVGVDVFLVISGFLITSHLIRRPVRSGADLLEFWARRVRRLIPAASLVLLVTLAAAVVWLPATVRGVVGREVLAAALYVENWALARSATDYLAADQLHTPVQHYWSLSVEEQFYLAWPVALALVGWAVLRVRRRRLAPAAATGAGVAALVLAAVTVAASLAWSVHLTAADPAAAYFVTTTRVWELALGGLLAAVVVLRPLRLRPGVRAALAWAGLALVLAAVATFDGETPFPGWTALVPTVGTALVVAAAADGVAAGPGGLLGRRGVQWLGDVSYSVYLWHWPLVVITPFALARPLGLPEQLAVVAATLVLAALTKRFVEDPVRRSRRLARRRAATFAVLAAGMLVVGGAALVVADRAAAAESAAADVVAEGVEAAGPCVGAGVVRDSSCGEVELFMAAEFAAEDKPAPYADGCWNNAPFTTRHTCTYSGVDADAGGPAARVALVGNSHAGHWLPALEDVIDADDWELTTYLQSVCYPVDRPLEFDGAGEAEGCLATNRWAVRSIVEGGYDLVILSARTNQRLAGVAPEDHDTAVQEAYAGTLDAFTAAGIPVLVLRDTPAMPGSVPDCLASHQDDPGACGAPRGTAVEPDPLAAAAANDGSGLVTLVDVTDLMCDAGRCHAVVGGLVAYFDHGHLTTTFARTLAPEVTAGARAALASRG
jgi:peptidoglycan/LPS O-acetylase OafA/YrhL